MFIESPPQLTMGFGQRIDFAVEFVDLLIDFFKSKVHILAQPLDLIGQMGQ